LQAQVAQVHAIAGVRPVWAGIGANRLSQRETLDDIASARRAGAQGVILFSYDSLISPPKGTEYLFPRSATEHSAGFLTFAAARRVLEEAVAERAFPAASIEVGTASQILWREAFGRLTFDAAAPRATPTRFRLASLTKVLSTAPLVMQQVERGALGLDDRSRDTSPRGAATIAPA
jgi:CubicO group peptidase (beta-lactamase class C family)